MDNLKIVAVDPSWHLGDLGVDVDMVAALVKNVEQHLHKNRVEALLVVDTAENTAADGLALDGRNEIRRDELDCLLEQLRVVHLVVVETTDEVLPRVCSDLACERDVLNEIVRILVCT